MKYKISCIGNQWRGSDDGSLFRAFARAGHMIDIIDDKMFIPADVFSNVGKGVRKISLPLFIADYNKIVLSRIRTFQPDIVCVYKGASLEEETLLEIKALDYPVFCIYPDVSIFDHGKRIPKCIPHYDYIFTTKSYGIQDLKDHFNYSSVSLIHHSADPDVHRKLDLSGRNDTGINCDASFIGSHSSKKESVLRELLHSIPSLNLKIWGGHWNKATAWPKVNSIQLQTVLGDGYAYAINSSKINLGILSEAGGKSKSGDLLTSRTFHIPGAGGFLLHERNEEVLEIFKEDVEAVMYAGVEELSDKVSFYLTNASNREKIAQAGHELVMKYHTSDHRVLEILSSLIKNGILER